MSFSTAGEEVFVSLLQIRPASNKNLKVWKPKGSKCYWKKEAGRTLTSSTLNLCLTKYLCHTLLYMNWCSCKIWWSFGL